MLDRFKDAKWYIGGDPLSATIFDASDLEGDGPDGLGMVCQDAVIEDARLIASAPELLTALINLTHALGDDHELCLWCEDLSWEQRDDMPHHVDCVAGKARAAIAKVEGWLVCQDGQHRCFNTGQPCGCRCDDCRDDTEPRCDICNGLINKYGSAIGHCENESDHEGRE